MGVGDLILNYDTFQYLDYSYMTYAMTFRF